MKKRGHYCKVCGEYKANEKFSGKGHAAHICKTCAALPPEKQAEEMTLTRLVNLPLAIIQRTTFVAEETDEGQAGCRANPGDGTI